MHLINMSILCVFPAINKTVVDPGRMALAEEFLHSHTNLPTTKNEIDCDDF